MAEEKKEEKKEDSIVEDILFWLIIAAVGYGLITSLSARFGGDTTTTDGERIEGGLPVDFNGDGIIDGYTVEGRRGLVGIDRDGDGIIDEYVDQNEVGRTSVYSRFMADPSWSNAFRIVRTTPWLWNIIVWGQFVLYGLSAVFFVLVWFLARKRQALAKAAEQGQVVNPLAVLVMKEKGHYIPDEDDDVTKRWKSIQAKIGADIPDGWKTAILEADIMLDELLDMNSYRGDTIGDKLKGVDPADFHTLNQAWEAHKIRNAIAHEGEGFALTSREAHRVIGLYEEVFKEFELI